MEVEMVRRLMGTKTSHRKTFIIKDQDNLVNIKQPNVMEVALLYGVLLEKRTQSKDFKF